MKIKVLTTCDNPNYPGYQRLKASLDHFGYDYELIVHPFAFGHQMPIIQKWCERYNGDCTHMLYTDAYDTLAFSGPDEVIEKFPQGFKMLISGEKACYPDADRAKDYPQAETPWKYVNGGGWLVEIDYFKKLCIMEKLTNQSHDQRWLMECFLRNQNEIQVDTQCRIFQTIAFSNKEEWDPLDGRFWNTGTGTLPIFFHGNGRTEMNWVYNQFDQLIK